MDQILQNHLDKWHGQIERIREAESMFKQLESYTRSLVAKLLLSSDRKTIAEREAAAYSSDEYINHQKGLVAAELEYLNERRLLEYQKEELQCAYLSCKNDHDFIRNNT